MAPNGTGMLRWAGSGEGHFPGSGIVVTFCVGNVRGGRRVGYGTGGWERDAVMRVDRTRWWHCMVLRLEGGVWRLGVHASSEGIRGLEAIRLRIPSTKPVCRRHR